MSTDNNPTEITDGVVVTLEYTLTVKGEILDGSDEEGPLPYLHGHANIIEGLEKELTGLKIGDTKNVTVAPAEGYGEFDPEAVLLMEREDFPDDIPLKQGIELEMVNEEGEVMLGVIVDVAGDVVRLDTNHPLAGETLEFDVKVIELRTATAEELDHGHAHVAGHHHH